jgi:hypothetical protein
MMRLSILLAAALAAGAGFLAAAPGAVAGGGLDYGPGPERHSGRCLRGVRAVGKNWPFASVARRSAVRAWERETRYVHGDAYAHWTNARRRDIECRRVNAFSRKCEARANPCRM